MALSVDRGRALDMRLGLTRGATAYRQDRVEQLVSYFCVLVYGGDPAFEYFLWFANFWGGAGPRLTILYSKIVTAWMVGWVSVRVKYARKKYIQESYGRPPRTLFMFA